MPSVKNLRRLVLISLALTLSAAVGGADTAVAVIVNQSSSVRDLSMRDLEKMLKVEKQYWDDGKKVYLVLQESGSAEKEIVREKLLHMSEADVKKLMLAKLFRGDITALPKTLSSRASVVKFVATIPNAIGYVDVSATDASVRILRIDGKAPGDPGYQLSSATP
jgi:ABC-type phosphate transport system substrate-binding protein